MALFNEANQAGMTQPGMGALAPEAPRPATQNERIMDLVQRMAEKDKQISELAEALQRVAQFVGLPL
ncbi:MAG: hypothetical protein ACLPJW_17570 [Rhodomicrobium sp.]